MDFVVYIKFLLESMREDDSQGRIARKYDGRRENGTETKFAPGLTCIEHFIHMTYSIHTLCEFI
jgi:hypothetical protein